MGVKMLHKVALVLLCFFILADAAPSPKPKPSPKPNAMPQWMPGGFGGSGGFGGFGGFGMPPPFFQQPPMNPWSYPFEGLPCDSGVYGCIPPRTPTKRK